MGEGRERGRGGGVVVCKYIYIYIYIYIYGSSSNKNTCALRTAPYTVEFLPCPIQFCCIWPKLTQNLTAASSSHVIFIYLFFLIFILPPETYLQCVYIGKITIDTKNT